MESTIDFLQETLDYIQNDRRLMRIVNPDGKLTPYRMDQLGEALRRVEYDKAEIENSAFKGQYNKDLSDDQIIENMEKAGRFDANEGLVFARQLEEIDPTRYEVVHKPLTKWKEVLPVKTFTPGIDRITYRLMDQTGEAVLSSPGNITDVPMADANASEFSNGVFAWVLGYMYTAQELRRAAVAGVPLPSEKIIAVERGYAKRLQATMFNGDTRIGLKGFINATGVTNTQAPLGASGTDRTWPGLEKTNDEIAKDITDGASRIRVKTFGEFGESNLTVALSQSRFDFIATTRMASGTDTTIMQFILANSASNGISRFVVVHDLSDTGTGDSHLMIIYPMENRVLEANVAEQILWMPMENRGTAFIFSSEMEFGGVTVRYAIAMDQTYGI